MGKILRESMKMERWIHFLRQGLSLAGALIILYGCYGIFTRAVFKVQDLWFNDLILMVLVSVLWLFSIYVVAEKRETTMEAVPDLLHGRRKAVYKAVTDLLSGLCCLALGLSGVASVISLIELDLNISTVLPVPQWVPILCFIAGMLGSSAAFFARAVHAFRQKNGNG
jgi:TRAP-type C4-dicarboxylate transport system permease small subunit